MENVDALAVLSTLEQELGGLVIVDSCLKPPLLILPSNPYQSDPAPLFMQVCGPVNITETTTRESLKTNELSSRGREPNLKEYWT